jgi:hypothetical protein
MTYTCSDYRLEMILLGIRRRLHEEELLDDEKERLQKEIRRIEAEMEMQDL